MRPWSLLFLLFFAPAAESATVADHTAIARFDSIPAAVFQEIRDEFSGYFGHTSHGGQLIAGMGMLAAVDETKYDAPAIVEVASDLGELGSLVWNTQTRQWLALHPETNLVIWSWCGGASTNTPEGIAIYLDAMDRLETDFPAIVFVYMTGHLDGTGVDGVLYRNNNLIRDYCRSNDKVLYDFADIESWDPDGNYYPDESDACGWCLDWCATHSCADCGLCEHSHCFNCEQKGKAFWWLLATLRGWFTTPSENPSLGGFKSMFR